MHKENKKCNRRKKMKEELFSMAMSFLMVAALFGMMTLVHAQGVSFTIQGQVFDNPINYYTT